MKFTWEAKSKTPNPQKTPNQQTKNQPNNNKKDKIISEKPVEKFFVYCWLNYCRWQQKEISSSDAALYYLLHWELLDFIAKFFCLHDQTVHAKAQAPWVWIYGLYYLYSTTI